MMVCVKMTARPIGGAASGDHEVTPGEVVVNAKIIDAGATGSLEDRLHTSLLGATNSDDESNGSRVENHEEDAGSDKDDVGAGGDDDGCDGGEEPTNEAGEDEEGERAASRDVTAKVDEADTEVAGDATSHYGRSKAQKVPNPRTFQIKPSWMSMEDIIALDDGVLIVGYHLPGNDVELFLEEDKVFVFCDYFVARLVIPRHSFTESVPSSVARALSYRLCSFEQVCVGHGQLWW